MTYEVERQLFVQTMSASHYFSMVCMQNLGCADHCLPSLEITACHESETPLKKWHAWGEEKGRKEYSSPRFSPGTTLLFSSKVS